MKYTLNRCIAAGFPRRAIVAIGGLLSAGLLAVSVSACGPSQAPQAIIIAASATANEPAPGLSAGIVQMLRSTGAASTKATAYVVAPGTGQPTILPLTPRRADGQVDFGPTRSRVLIASPVVHSSGLVLNTAACGQRDHVICGPKGCSWPSGRMAAKQHIFGVGTVPAVRAR
jgi:hypothetical protein